MKQELAEIGELGLLNTTRKLILTPYEQGGLAAMNTVFNDSPLAVKNSPLDLPHILQNYYNQE